MIDSPTERRLPWMALALSFLSVGVGHVYCGRVAKGLVLYFAWFAVPILCLIAAVLPVSTLTMVACILVPVISIFAIYLHAAVDAYRSAKRCDPHYKLQDYNRAGIYGLLIAVQLVSSLALMAGTRAFVFEAFYIPMRSMNPTVLEGDRVLVNKLIARNRFPERGDLIVFHNPTPQGGRNFIKRVIALAGDTVVIEGDHVEINGKRLPRERIPGEALREIQDQITGNAFYEFNTGRRYKVGYGDFVGKKPVRERFEIVVPARSVFVLGDNRDRSRDSRHFGAIHMVDVIGYAQYVHFPAESWSRFGASLN